MFGTAFPRLTLHLPEPRVASLVTDSKLFPPFPPFFSFFPFFPFFSFFSSNRPVWLPAQAYDAKDEWAHWTPDLLEYRTVAQVVPAFHSRLDPPPWPSAEFACQDLSPGSRPPLFPSSFPPPFSLLLFPR